MSGPDNPRQCPLCGSDDILFSPKHELYNCESCGHQWSPGIEPSGDDLTPQQRPLRIFLSYGHDEYVDVALRIKRDLEARGHTVWFDLDKLKARVDWEGEIERGIVESDRVVLIMTPHSVRRRDPHDPSTRDGFCLNEIAKAVERNKLIIPIMLVWVDQGPPTSICRIQWLDMTDCIPIDERVERYETRFERLAQALEQNDLDFEGAHARIRSYLKPLDFMAEMERHIANFTGREWLFHRIDQWLNEQPESRVFWLLGGPGVGKSAVATQLAHRRGDVAAVHFCVHGHSDYTDGRKAVLSIAYQISTHLPEYEKMLKDLQLEDETTKDTFTLFQNIIVKPLHKIEAPQYSLLVVIDALDEAPNGGRNEIAEFIAAHWRDVPPWLRLVITSRPDPAVMTRLAAYKPYVLNAESPENIEDLRSFLNFVLQRMSGENPSSAVVEHIIKKSEGIFLYVKVVADEVWQRRLSLDDVDAFPDGLAAYYRLFFSRQFHDVDQYKKELRPVLSAVVAQREPLPLSLLSLATGVEMFDLRERLQTVGSLFPIRKTRYGKKIIETIQPFHKSVGDWLTETDEVTGAFRAGAYAVNLDAGRHALARGCWAEYKDGLDAISDYALHNLTLHLWQSGRTDDLLTLMLDFDFIEAKICAFGPQRVIRDYDLLLESGVVSSAELAKELALLQGAVRLSAHVLFVDGSQLASQLYGRLLSFDSPHIRKMLDYMLARKGVVWIRPLPPGLTAPGGALLRTLEGHQRRANAIALSPDGKRAVSASDDCTLKVWNLSTGIEEMTLSGHIDAVRDVAITPDGKRAVSASLDRTLKVWNIELGQEECTLTGHTDWVWAVAVSPDGAKAVSASRDQTIKIWDIETGRNEQTLNGHTGVVNALVVTHDGSRAISASDDCTLKIWDIKTGKVQRTLSGHTMRVTSVALTPDSSRVVSASDDKTLKVWDLANGNVMHTLTGHTGFVRAVALTPDGNYAVSASWDRTLRIWDISRGSEIKTLEGHSERINAVSITADGKKIISASSDWTLNIWDFDTEPEKIRPRGHTGEVRAVAVTPDCARAVSASRDRTLKVWDLDSKRELLTLEGHTAWVGAVAISNDAEFALSGSDDYSLKLWELATGKEIRSFGGHEDWVWDVAVTPDGTQAVSASADKTLKIWNLETGDLERTLEGHTAWVLGVAVTPNGEKIVSGSSDKTVKVWELATGKLLLSIDAHPDWVRGVVVTPDGKKIVSASSDRTLRLWNIETGELERTFEGHTDWVRDVTVTPDGMRLVSVSSDRTLRLWDIATGGIVATFYAEGPVNCCAVCHDGETYVIGEASSNLRFLHLEEQNA